MASQASQNPNLPKFTDFLKPPSVTPTVLAQKKREAEAREKEEQEESKEDSGRFESGSDEENEDSVNESEEGSESEGEDTRMTEERKEEIEREPLERLLGPAPTTSSPLPPHGDSLPTLHLGASPPPRSHGLPPYSSSTSRDERARLVIAWSGLKEFAGRGRISGKKLVLMRERNYVRVEDARYEGKSVGGEKKEETMCQRFLCLWCGKRIEKEGRVRPMSFAKHMMVAHEEQVKKWGVEMVAEDYDVKRALWRFFEEKEVIVSDEMKEKLHVDVKKRKREDLPQGGEAKRKRGKKDISIGAPASAPASAPSASSASSSSAPASSSSSSSSSTASSSSTPASFSAPSSSTASSSKSMEFPFANVDIHIHSQVATRVCSTLGMHELDYHCQQIEVQSFLQFFLFFHVFFSSLIWHPSGYLVQSSIQWSTHSWQLSRDGLLN